MRLLSVLLSSLLITNTASAETYAEFLDGLRAELTEKKIPVSLLDEALGENPTVDESVIKKLKKQPESTYTFDQYFDRLVSKLRVKNGKAKFDAHQADLQAKEDEYGVPKEIMLALWGVETAYGKLPGNYGIVPSLATLAYKSHRKEFFRKELVESLRIVQQGHIPLSDLKGSWAGAMGQCQFMPSSFFRFAADGNGDGRKDIWQTEVDVFASTGNYISKSGWVNKNWGDRVTLTKFLPKMKISERGLSEIMTVGEFSKMGVQLKKSRKQDMSRKARLFMPDGPSGNSYMVYENFDVIMKWNRSSYFAFAVLSLGDKIAGRKGLKS